MNLDTLPPDYGAGLDFNFNVWTPNTTITLCNVPWSADYRDIVYFDGNDSLIEYLGGTEGPSIHYTGSTLVVPGKPIRLDIPVNVAYKYNYVHVHNPQMPGTWDNDVIDAPRDFYYFVSDVQYVAPNTTALYVQLDVWQSFGRYVEFGQCYIERGHIGIANENQFDNNGRNYLTIPEGLDIGNEYQIAFSDWYTIASARERDYSVMVWSNTCLYADPGTVASPKMVSANGSRFEWLPNSVDIYIFEYSDWIAALAYLKDYPWVTQGIISIMALPTSILSDDYIQGNDVMIGVGTARLASWSGASAGVNQQLSLWHGAVVKDKILELIPAEYRHLKKFATYPYSVIEMTTNNGTPIIIKPECLNTDDLIVNQHTHFAPPSPRLMFSVDRYNTSDEANWFLSPDGDYRIFSGGEDFDMMTGISNFPTFSILNNSYTNYMASNAASLAYSADSASWAQSRSLAGAQAGFDVASNAIGANSAATSQSNNASAQQMIIANQTNAAQTSLQNDQLVKQQLLNVAQGVGGGLGSGGLVGGIAGGVAGLGTLASTSITMSGNSQSSAITQGSNFNSNAVSRANNTALTGISNSASAYSRDTNLSLANYAANGDYQNAIAGINAKTQDAKLMQPTTSGQVGGEAFNLVATGWYLVSKLKMLDAAYVRSIATYWMRYGYAVNQFGRLPSDYQCMGRFTYWKLRETYIRSALCPEVFKTTIRGIFEKGVTVWGNADDNGNIAMTDNRPLKGFAL